jgi:Tfp pilus assembly protein PilN
MMALKTTQHLPVHLLEELANCLPDDVWFKEINQKGMNISIKGESTSFEAINQFRSRLLEQSKWFQNVNYPEANKKDRTVEFTISCDLKNSA